MTTLNLNDFKTVLNDDFTKDTSLNTHIWSAHWGNSDQYSFTGANGLLLQGFKSQGWNGVGIEQAPYGKSAGEGYGLYSFTGKASVAGEGPGMCFLMWRADNVWLDSSHPGLLTEMDLIETSAGLKYEYSANHYYYSSSKPGGQNDHGLGAISMTQFHTYSMDWEAGSFTYYIDGQEIYQVTGSTVPKDYAHGGVNYTLGAEVLNEASGATTSTVGTYIKDISYSVRTSGSAVSDASTGASTAASSTVAAAAPAVAAVAVAASTSTVSALDNVAIAPTFISRHSLTVALTANETLDDRGWSNTLVFPASGGVTLSGNILGNGDHFDLRAAMSKTSWDGKSSDLASYLSAGKSSDGKDLEIMLKQNAKGSAIVLATLKNEASQPDAFANFEKHAIF